MIAWLALPAALATTVPPPPEGSRIGRPVLSGPVQTMDSEDGFFRVHWTNEGEDRVGGDDADADGIPDAITRTLDTLVASRELYEERGYRPLIGDGGGGGSDAIDLYLQTVDINGYAHGVRVDGETDRGSCWVEVDGRLAGSGSVLESVVAHELHHCVQYRYTWEAASWIHEATSTYEQYLAVSDSALLLALGVLWSTRLNGVDLPIDSLFGRYEYAGFVFIKFWEELGGSDGVRTERLWQALAEEPDWQLTLHDQAHAEWGQGLGQTFLDHATWNGFACGRDDGQHYGDELLPCLGDISVPVEIVEADSFEIEHDAAPYTAAYVELPAAGSRRPFHVHCDGPGADAEAWLRLVPMDAEGRALEEQPDDVAVGTEGLEVRLEQPIDSEGSVLAVFASTGVEPAVHACTAGRHDAEEAPLPTEQTGCTTGVGPAGAWILVASLLALPRRRRS